ARLPVITSGRSAFLLRRRLAALGTCRCPVRLVSVSRFLFPALALFLRFTAGRVVRLASVASLLRAASFFLRAAALFLGCVALLVSASRTLISAAFSLTRVQVVRDVIADGIGLELRRLTRLRDGRTSLGSACMIVAALFGFSLNSRPLSLH